VNGSELRAAFKDGRTVWGTTIVYARNVSAAAVYGQLGFDYAIVDAEHSPNGRSELVDMGAAPLKAGVCPVVRVPTAEPYQTIMALDAGCLGEPGLVRGVPPVGRDGPGCATGGLVACRLFRASAVPS
jgi:2-keto-3-deoxy-L-rhamnonate aldolase RhmA